MTVNQNKLREAIDKGYSISLDIAEHLVRKGIPFREAHKIVGHLVQIASNSKKSLTQLSISEVKSSISKNEIDAKDLYKTIQSTTPESSLESRKSQGSSGKNEQKRMILDRKKKVQAYVIGTSKRTNEVRTAIESLENNVKTIIKNKA
jgi:argininosuccinate lyase